MQRPKAGRRGQDDVVGAAVDHLLIGIQADETAFFGHIRLVAELLDGVGFGQFQQALAATVGAELENIADGDNLHIGGSMKHVLNRSIAPAAAADQADLDRVAAFGVDVR